MCYAKRIRANIDKILETWRTYCAELNKHEERPADSLGPNDYYRELTIVLSEVTKVIQSPTKNKSSGLSQMLGEKGLKRLYDIKIGTRKNHSWLAHLNMSRYIKMRQDRENYWTLLLIHNNTPAKFWKKNWNLTKSLFRTPKRSRSDRKHFLKERG